MSDTPPAQHEGHSPSELSERNSSQTSQDNPLNKVLDTTDFDGDLYNCINAAQVGGRNFKGGAIMH